MVYQHSFHTLGEFIRELRTARGLSQTELVELAELDSKAKLSRIENGLVEPTPQQLGRIAKAIGTSVEVFYAAAKYPLPYCRLYEEPGDYFEDRYKIEATTPENIDEIGRLVCADYRKWLKRLGDFTQEGVNRENEVLEKVKSGWPMGQTETAVYEWFRLLDEKGLR